MDLEKLEVTKEWPMPRIMHKLKSFIGMCAYFCCFIAIFSSTAGPLHDLTKKSVRFIWMSKQEKAFNMLKENLISQPVLVLSNVKKPFEVQCDACGKILEVVLLQEGHPIAYEKRRLKPQEQVLGIYKKELLAVINALSS